MKVVSVFPVSSSLEQIFCKLLNILLNCVIAPFQLLETLGLEVPWPIMINYDDRMHVGRQWRKRISVFTIYFKIQINTSYREIRYESQAQTCWIKGETLPYETGVQFCMGKTKRKRNIRIAPLKEEEEKTSKLPKCNF